MAHLTFRRIFTPAADKTEESYWTNARGIVLRDATETVPDEDEDEETFDDEADDDEDDYEEDEEEEEALARADFWAILDSVTVDRVSSESRQDTFVLPRFCALSAQQSQAHCFFPPSMSAWPLTFKGS